MASCSSHLRKRMATTLPCVASRYQPPFTHKPMYYHRVHFSFSTKPNNDEEDKKKKENVEQSLFSQLQSYWNQGRDDTESDGMQYEKKVNAHNEWITKYNEVKEANTFKIDELHRLDITTQWEFFSILHIKDPLYRWGMNTWFTGFADRFLSYEEFMCGVVEGFQFMVECLADNEFNALKDCMAKEVYQHIAKLKTSLLCDGQRLDKVMASVYNVRADRERIDLQKVSQAQTQAALQFNTPVDLFFDVKYYCQFIDTKQQTQHKIIDVLWHAKYNPVAKERLKYEIATPWTMQHITVSNIAIS